MHRFRTSLFSFVVVLMSCSLQAQTAKTTSVVGPRPVRDVILQWEKQYGWVITYEDPRFEYADDLEDVTTKVRKDLKPGEPIGSSMRIIGARERRLSVTYTPPQTANDTVVRLKATKQLVSAYAPGTGTTFDIQQSDTRLHILPGLVRDASGDLQPSRPIMSTVVSLPAQERTGAEFLHALCDTLSSATGHTISLGMISAALAQFQTKAGYENLPARQILESFLNQMPEGKRYTWALLFQKDYALNIHMVADLSQPTESAPIQPSTRRTVVAHSADGTQTIYITK